MKNIQKKGKPISTQSKPVSQPASQWKIDRERHGIWKRYKAGFITREQYFKELQQLKQACKEDSHA